MLIVSVLLSIGSVFVVLKGGLPAVWLSRVTLLSGFRLVSASVGYGLDMGMGMLQAVSLP